MANEIRKIIHIDMDAFFASVEQHDRPELRGKPIAIGYDGKRGVVATASYEARPYGVHSAQPISTAKRLCPHLIIVKGRHDRYKEVSRQVHKIFNEYTDIIEPLSLDEAFLDVTHNKKGITLAVDIAREIKQRIKEITGLTASAGISYNKLLAKIASDWRKPDGLCTIHPDRALEFINNLKIEKFWGVGPKTAERMRKMGISTGADLRNVPLDQLLKTFGKSGPMFYDFARGIDNRPVIVERVRKSVGCEQTFLDDISRNSSVIIELYHVVLELIERIAHDEFEGRTLTLKVKYADFKQITRSITCYHPLTTKDDILPLAKQLLSQIDYNNEHPIRLLGLTVSNPTSDNPQQSIQLEINWKSELNDLPLRRMNHKRQ